MPIMAQPPTPPQPALTSEDHARIAWAWLHDQCAPSTWKAFAASVAVRQPQVKEWTS